MKELVIKKCFKCNAIVRVIEDCNCDDCGIKCCGEQMKALKANATDGAVEKHVPTYEIKGDTIEARVNHVMEEDHYIEWISIVFENKTVTTYLNPGEEPCMHCKYVPGSTIYAYCNKHSIWKKDVE